MRRATASGGLAAAAARSVARATAAAAAVLSPRVHRAAPSVPLSPLSTAAGVGRTLGGSRGNDGSFKALSQHLFKSEEGASRSEGTALTPPPPLPYSSVGSANARTLSRSIERSSLKLDPENLGKGAGFQTFEPLPTESEIMAADTFSSGDFGELTPITASCLESSSFGGNPGAHTIHQPSAELPPGVALSLARFSPVQKAESRGGGALGKLGRGYVGVGLPYRGSLAALGAAEAAAGIKGVANITPPDQLHGQLGEKEGARLCSVGMSDLSSAPVAEKSSSSKRHSNRLEKSEKNAQAEKEKERESEDASPKVSANRANLIRKFSRPESFRECADVRGDTGQSGTIPGMPASQTWHSGQGSLPSSVDATTRGDSSGGGGGSGGGADRRQSEGGQDLVLVDCNHTCGSEAIASAANEQPEGSQGESGSEPGALHGSPLGAGSSGAALGRSAPFSRRRALLVSRGSTGLASGIGSVPAPSPPQSTSTSPSPTPASPDSSPPSKENKANPSADTDGSATWRGALPDDDMRRSGARE
ncbi:hypothetical protein T492DRAFT_832529 [Pavlovales sp. CCMP2436]|nr:hypothetical protein T492DRAFT_832529 [Pavlovales sp. CCMP2436]